MSKPTKEDINEYCKGCENIQIEKDVGGTGHCYMFREFVPNCQLYKQARAMPNKGEGDE